MPVHELAALGAALCWSVTGIMASGAVMALGPFAFNRLRWWQVFVMLAAIVLATGRWHGIDAADFWRIALSGIFGILLGDMMLFMTMVRLGPRRTGALFALQGGQLGIVSTLSALSPVLILPVLWMLTGARLSATSWGGAALAVLGMALIFLR